MSGFFIDLSPAIAANSDESCRIRIGVGELVFTRLLRDLGHQPDDALLAPPAPLAFWVCDHWWRLRWDSVPSQGLSARWRLAHELAAIGDGYAWPRLAIWGDVDRIGLLSRADPVGVVGPVRYLTDALAYVDASEFETAVDDFLDQVTDELQGFGADRSALRALISALRAERAEPGIARWRRLEARLGYDPDDGPDELIEAAEALANRFGLEAVEEALTALPGSDAVKTLDHEVQMTREQGWICDFSAVLGGIEPVCRKPWEPPWVVAESVAGQVRAIAGIPQGPLHNQRLADLLGVTTKFFREPAHRFSHAYGLRLDERGGGARQSVSLRSAWPEGRRFELCRALGDAVWSRDEALGPLVRTSTARQKFQRAFSQSLLCPFEDLRAFLGTDRPDEDEIAAAAHHFHVADRVVQTVLVNKRVIERERFLDLLEAA